MLTSRLDIHILRYGNFCAHDNNDDKTDYFTPCACVRGKEYLVAMPQRYTQVGVQARSVMMVEMGSLHLQCAFENR